LSRRPPLRSAPPVDPDPIIIDLLVGLTGTAIAGAIKKVGQKVLARRRRRQAELVAPPTANQVGVLRRSLDDLERRIDQALALIQPGQKRELGGQILLDQHSIRQYHELRDGLFTQVRTVDDLVEGLLPNALDDQAGVDGGRMRLPSEFREQLRFVERKLREARTATLADEALLEMRSAVVAMRRMIDYIESAGQS
jgi:hypothetical protein